MPIWQVLPRMQQPQKTLTLLRLQAPFRGSASSCCSRPSMLVLPRKKNSNEPSDGEEEIKSLSLQGPCFSKRNRTSIFNATQTQPKSLFTNCPPMSVPFVSHQGKPTSLSSSPSLSQQATHGLPTLHPRCIGLQGLMTRPRYGLFSCWPGFSMRLHIETHRNWASQHQCQTRLAEETKMIQSDFKKVPSAVPGEFRWDAKN